MGFGLETVKEGTFQLMQEILDIPSEALDLCRHSFGHHVAQCILEHGDERHRDMVAEVLLSDPFANASNRSASYVIESALCHCSPGVQEALLQQLTSPAVLAGLAESP